MVYVLLIFFLIFQRYYRILLERKKNLTKFRARFQILGKLIFWLKVQYILYNVFMGINFTVVRTFNFKTVWVQRNAAGTMPMQVLHVRCAYDERNNFNDSIKQPQKRTERTNFNSYFFFINFLIEIAKINE